jgi:hypothetical protein
MKHDAQQQRKRSRGIQGVKAFDNNGLIHESFTKSRGWWIHSVRRKPSLVGRELGSAPAGQNLLQPAIHFLNGKVAGDLMTADKIDMLGRLAAQAFAQRQPHQSLTAQGFDSAREQESRD